MLELNNIDYNNLEDIKKVKKLKKSELLEIFKDSEIVESLTKNQLLELLLENEIFLELKERLLKLESENMELRHQVTNLKRTENGKKYMELEKRYREAIRDLERLRTDKYGYVEKLEKEIRELNWKIGEIEGQRDYYKSMYLMNLYNNGVSNSANNIDFKPYYRKLAMYLHPDKQGGNDEGMKILNELKDKFNN